jgi:hypothetical protein
MFLLNCDMAINKCRCNIKQIKLFKGEHCTALCAHDHINTG